MPRPLALLIGALLVVLGLVVALRGLGIVGGSGARGSTVWALLGPVVAGFGVALLARGLRRDRR